MTVQPLPVMEPLTQRQIDGSLQAWIATATGPAYFVPADERADALAHLATYAPEEHLRVKTQYAHCFETPALQL